ncbi:HVO_0476 family zinc finger protein [Archaeoglobus neptunius]|uniref:HVO_0476 family zinc finger protein n=1 Tax=Archaeoglobus neptunius TaxID=2798580 RepID=UPI00192543A7|nr:HVO_0476 family zinc finger protein [Archaeoglobus neptunius]
MREYIYCDTCKEETLHELVRAERNLYRCTECGSYTTYTPRKEIELRAIISSGPESVRGTVRVRKGDRIEKGEEYIVDTDRGHKIGEITSIELKNGQRVESSDVEKIETLWLRDVGEVELRMSLHKRSVTTPFKMVVDGEAEFEVGETLVVNGRRYRIHRIKLINGGVLRKEGSRARARDIRRVYAKYEGR